MIGIISYFPEEEKLRAVRKKNADIQLNWLSSIFPEEVPVVIAQGYREEDLRDDINVEYRLYEEGIGSTASRNLLLDMFYNSDDEWLLLLDDDVVNYPYYDADELIHGIYHGEIEVDADIILPLMPEHSPFKKLNLKQDVSHYYNFVVSPVNNCPNMMLYRNRQDKRFFKQNVDLLHENAIPDDSRFIVDAVADGLTVYQCNCWIKKSLDIIKSVIYDTNEKVNKAQHSVLVSNLKKYVQSQYKVKSLMDFNKKYSKAFPFRIERKNVYEIPENLSTINHYKKKKKNLF